MAASGCGRPGSGKGAVGHWRVASLLTIFSSSSSTKSVSCLGQRLQSLSPPWFLRTSFLFSIFSSLVLPPWLFCPFLPCADWAMVLLPKAFHLDCLSHGSCDPWWLEQAGAGKKGKPCSPYGLLGPGQYKSGEWLARMQAYCRHSPSLSSPVPVTPTPSCSFLLPPGLTKNVLSTVSPFPRPWGTERPWYECKDATSLSGKLCG